jgi:catechol 2,3-dioxygenase-like lactoylglutathione lyase family enzyme
MDDDLTITRDIYPMPAFLTLTVSDLERSVRWYTQGLDFVELARMPQLVHLRRFRNQDILLFPPQPGRPAADPGAGWSFSLRGGPGLPVLAERLAAHAPVASTGVQRTPWNVDELRCTDPDGYIIVFSERVPEDEMDQAFSAVVLGSLVPGL